VFAHEAGYASVFDMPMEFVRVDITLILIATGAMLPILYLMFWLANFMLMALPGSDSPIRRSLIRLFPGSLLVVSLLVLYGARGVWLLLVPFLLIVIFIEFGFPLITHRKEASYREKLIAQERSDREIRFPVFDLFVRFAGRGGSYVFLGLMIIATICHARGRSSALNKDEFLVTTTSEEMVVLRIYDDKLICAPFERATREIKRSFVVLKVGEDPNLVLNLETVGPLHPKD